MNADQLHVLLPIGEVRVQPDYGSVANTKVGLVNLTQQVMGDCIKRRRYVQTDQHGGLLVVSSGVYTVHDMQQRSLGSLASGHKPWAL